MRHRKSAFTLIELLTVMAIIAVLAGMIMSALGRAKNSPRKAQCLNNLIWLRAAGTRADFSPAIQAQWNPRYGWPETRRTQPEMNLRTGRSQEQKKQKKTKNKKESYATKRKLYRSL